jgi:hypothetical protein
MGLAFPGAMDCNDFSCFPSLFNTLVNDSASGVKDVFAICGGYREEPRDKAAAFVPISPVLLLGGGDSRLYDGNITYVPMVEPFNFYQIGVVDVMVGSGANVTSLDDGRRFPPMIIDTGTTDLYMPASVYQSFKAHLQKHYCHIQGVCGHSGHTIFDGVAFLDPDHTLFALPSLQLVMNNKDNFALKLSPQQYVRRWVIEESGAEAYWLAIYPWERDSFLIGEVLLNKYYLEFDRVKRRMGFATSVADCAGAIGQ